MTQRLVLANSIRRTNGRRQGREGPVETTDLERWTSNTKRPGSGPAPGSSRANGWDTHVNQGSTQGPLANNLASLGQGLLAYAEAMGEHWQDSLVVVVSEFGRTFRENGAKGTDHGHGTVYWVLGGGVRGGRIAGEQVAVNAQSLLQNRDYPVLNNYRDLLGGLLGHAWGLSSAQLQSVFPGARPVTLGLV